MSLQTLCGEPSVDERIRKVVCSAHSLGIQRFQCFARLLFNSFYDYVCGAVSFLGQVVPHRIKRSICMWIPDAERLKMSAAEVGGGEGHLSCVKNAHEKGLCRERLACYDAMLAAHEEKEESKLQSSLEWAWGRNAATSWSSVQVEYSPTEPSEMVMVESASGDTLLSDEE